MACGRLKNLEIAARNPLCGHGDRRRHSPTTGKAAGEGETPGHPAMGDFEASGRGEARRHPVRGKPRTTSAKGKTLGQLAEGKPRAMRRKESSEPPWQRENFEPPGLGGNPGSFGEKKALSHRHGNY